MEYWKWKSGINTPKRGQGKINMPEQIIKRDLKEHNEGKNESN